jgi:amphi-Trp domain-containing protein
MGEKKISYERMVDINEAVAYLESLAQSLRDGHIVAVHGEKTLALDPPSVVKLEIGAKQKKNKSKFGFEIAWKPVPEGETTETLIISSESETSADDAPVDETSSPEDV